MRVIALINQKGGVGKSSTAYNLGGALAGAGKKVLLVDLDQQTYLSKFLGLARYGNNTINEVLLGEISAKDAIIHRGGKIWAIPSSHKLKDTEFRLFTEIGREFILKDAMAEVCGYDFVLLDCPPSLGLSTLNALTYAKEMMVVLQPEPSSLEGVAQLIDTYKAIKNKMNPELEITGVVCNMMERKVLHREVLENIKTNLGDKVFNTVIPRRAAYTEATGFGKTIQEYRPKGPETVIMAQLAKELIKRGAKK